MDASMSPSHRKTGQDTTMTRLPKRLLTQLVNAPHPATWRPWLALALVMAASAAAHAAPKKPDGKKYHFELSAVTAKAEVKADVAKSATPRVEAQVKKAFATHPQLIATLDGAPDPKTS